MADFKVKDINLAPEGESLIHWASKHMPVLNQIKDRFQEEKPLTEVRIGACLHVTKETGVLMRTLTAGGADVALCASNPLSTQDPVAAALAEKGIDIYAWRGETTEEYYWCLNKVIDHKPHITIDDGADLVGTIHSQRKEALERVKGGTEETTTGVMRLRAMERAGELRYPIMAVNDAYTKYLFDNRYGTGQSTLDGIVRATNILLAGKNFVICGYGWCGRGLAHRAKGMGANVIITEVDPTRALEAVMEGFQVMPIRKASERGDIFVTATGNLNVVRKEHMLKMKDGAILANTGHFNVEISIPDLEGLSTSKRTVKPNVREYSLQDGRRLYLLADGRLVNLAAAEGHPSEVMDMSFANQALCIEHLVEKEEQAPKVHSVPQGIDQQVATLKLKAMNREIDSLTEEQKRYLKSWEAGTV
ncbi:adenosylhomocysteinase [Candidatus Bathyarchaeota archaeon]|nr:adenosylhomocysteinase [Candidatus Bathyarchaeota archaeon]NIU81481.1 adenosylhomocysteinase [Candidatus Bathyarchaeota archaeon]NIV67525.1 adenosylhomocysteinase [Candidatus Bathyarchaeota archaeon]NIW16506.1 adenosylhomocysteinase [Candidatus Bathyarchaeota archaeon]NIW34155.1 adenosylhomocysteinase [Candidatus Bathyarchaeota archaeon]